jgi:hypothetical protein
LPSVIWARGNRSWLAFTQSGAKLDSPFFQLANQSHAMRTLFCRAFSIAASATLKSYLPSSGSIQFQAMPVRTVCRCTRLASMGRTVFMYSRLEEAAATL